MDERRYMLAKALMGDWSDDNEKSFQRDMMFGSPWSEWRRGFAAKVGQQPDLNSPDYNYRLAWRYGAQPKKYEFDSGAYHWPSVAEAPAFGAVPLKAQNHPTAWMETFMQKFGTDPHSASPDQLQEGYRMGIVPLGRGQ